MLSYQLTYSSMRSLKSSRACAPRDSLRFSAPTIVILAFNRRFCSSRVSTRSEFQMRDLGWFGKVNTSINKRNEYMQCLLRNLPIHNLHVLEFFENCLHLFTTFFQYWAVSEYGCMGVHCFLHLQSKISCCDATVCIPQFVQISNRCFAGILTVKDKMDTSK